MRLQRLTAMEQEKIHAEMAEIKTMIVYLRSILNDRVKLVAEVEKELIALKEEYGDKRKTRFEAAIDTISEADLIPDEEVVVTLTRKGYIKRVPLRRITCNGVEEKEKWALQTYKNLMM